MDWINSLASGVGAALTAPAANAERVMVWPME